MSSASSRLSCLIIIRILMAIAAIKTRLRREVPESSRRCRELFDGAVRSHARHGPLTRPHMRSPYLTIRRAGSRSRAIAHALVAIATSLAAACGGDGNGYGGVTDPGGGGTPVPTATVQATPAIQFTPAAVELTVGGTVTFDFGTLEHNVFFDNAPPGAPLNITAPSANQTVVRTFATAGQYRYNCHIHPGMTGIINVH